MLHRAGIDPFKRIYNRVVQDHLENRVEWDLINRVPMYQRDEYFYDRLKKFFGFRTSGSGVTSRTGLYGNVFLNNVKLNATDVYDKVLINQILGLTIRDGRVDHVVGGHDDMVVAWNLSGWFMLSGQNLEHYGLDPRSVFSKNHTAQEVRQEEQGYGALVQDRTRRRVEEIVEALRQTKDEYVARRLELELRCQERLLNDSDRQYLSADSLITSLRESRSHQKRRYG